MTVKRWKASVQRGQKAGYAVTVSTINGSASDVTVTLASQPTSQKPTFTNGCAKDDGTASCKVSSVTDKQPFALEAQIAVAGNATSVSSVKLTATATIVTTAKWTPPAAAETVAVTAASPSPSPSSSSPSPSSSPGPAVPLGPLPTDLNNTSSSIIGAGNAAGLLPTIAPSSASGQAAGANAVGGNGSPSPVSNSYPLALGTTVVPAQVAGLIALAVALLLTMTRLSTRRRPAAKDAKGKAKDAEGKAKNVKEDDVKDKAGDSKPTSADAEPRPQGS